MQGVEPEARTFNTIIIACNLCGQPLQALEVTSSLFHIPHACKDECLQAPYG